MLQFIRSKAGSLAVKILFVLLIGSFGIWGIGDFLRQRPQDSTIATVGDKTISGDELQTEVRRALDRQRGLTLEQAKTLGIIDQVLDGLVARAEVSQLASREHLDVGDRQVLDAVQQQKAFQGPNGQFDRVTFQNVLAANKLTEAQYVATLRTDLPRTLAVAPAIDQAAAPATLTDLLYKTRNERRVADWVKLPASLIKDPPPPDEASLKAFYDKHHDTFTAPEYRGFTLLTLEPSDVAAGVKITDAQLKDGYQQRLDELTTPEKRHVMQMLLPDEAAANEAASQLAGGKDFVQVAKDFAKQDPATVDLGTVTKKELPNEIADGAFGAKSGEISKPAKGPFGWTILKVDNIQEGGVKSFDEAKSQIEAELRHEAEGQALYELSNKVQDALSGGQNLSQIATQFNLTPHVIKAADETGKGPDDVAVTGIGVPLDKVMKTVFETPADQVSAVEDVGDGAAYYVAKVDSITPSALTPFDQVKDKVQSAWLADERASALAKQAKELADAINPDTPLVKLATAQKLTITTTKPFTRSRGEAPLPAALTAKLFTLQPGMGAYAEGADGEYVAELRTVVPADPTTDKSGVGNTSEQLAQNIGTDLLDQLEGALKQRYPVQIRRAAIDALFPSSTE